MCAPFVHFQRALNSIAATERANKITRTHNTHTLSAQSEKKLELNEGNWPYNQLLLVLCSSWSWSSKIGSKQVELAAGLSVHCERLPTHSLASPLWSKRMSANYTPKIRLPQNFASITNFRVPTHWAHLYHATCVCVWAAHSHLATHINTHTHNTQLERLRLLTKSEAAAAAWLLCNFNAYTLCVRSELKKEQKAAKRVGLLAIKISLSFSLFAVIRFELMKLSRSIRFG